MWHWTAIRLELFHTWWDYPCEETFHFHSTNDYITLHEIRSHEIRAENLVSEYTDNSHTCAHICDVNNILQLKTPKKWKGSYNNINDSIVSIAIMIFQTRCLIQIIKWFKMSKGFIYRWFHAWMDWLMIASLHQICVCL